MADELLPKVDLFRVSEPAREALKALLREVLEEQSLKRPRTPAGALRAAAASRYVGVGRSHFYALLKDDPQLLALSFTAGSARMWSVASLDCWMKERQAGLCPSSVEQTGRLLSSQDRGLAAGTPEVRSDAPTSTGSLNENHQ